MTREASGNDLEGYARKFNEEHADADAEKGLNTSNEMTNLDSPLSSDPDDDLNAYARPSQRH